jgi:hypothetical protein
VRSKSLLSVVGLLAASCGGSEDFGDMTAAEAEQVCLARADRVVSPSDVNTTVTHKEDRYWDVLLGVDPPQNLVWCTINAVNGNVLRFSHVYQPQAAKKALRGGLWDNQEGSP